MSLALAPPFPQPGCGSQIALWFGLHALRHSFVSSPCKPLAGSLALPAPPTLILHFSYKPEPGASPHPHSAFALQLPAPCSIATHSTLLPPQPPLPLPSSAQGVSGSLLIPEKLPETSGLPRAGFQAQKEPRADQQCFVVVSDIQNTSGDVGIPILIQFTFEGP